jgi:hypothetical protein
MLTYTCGRVDQRHALARVAHEHAVVDSLAAVLQRLQQGVFVDILVLGTKLLHRCLNLHIQRDKTCWELQVTL